MRRTLTTSALAALAVAAGGATAPAQQAYTYYQPSAPAYRPAPGTYVDNRAVLPGFAPRGGIGTTPFLGNTRGLGAFSTNYDAPRTRATTAYPARRGWFFRRYR